MEKYEFLDGLKKKANKGGYFKKLKKEYDVHHQWLRINTSKDKIMMRVSFFEFIVDLDNSKR